jgi:hypothetical protein
MFVDDCVYGTRILMQSDVTEPLNVGSAHLVTINELVSIVEEIAGLRLRRRYKLDAPQGVRGRNSDNTLIKQRLGWEPEMSLEEGLEKTYAWMYEEMAGRSSRKRQVVFQSCRVSKSGSGLHGRLDGCGPFPLDAAKREDECRRDPPKTCEEDRSPHRKDDERNHRARHRPFAVRDRPEMAVQAARRIASNAISIPASPTSPVL